MFKRILVPIDGSETSKKALGVAVQMASEAGGSIRIIHALDDLSFMSGHDRRGDLISVAEENAKTLLTEAAASAKAKGIDADWKFIEKLGVRLGETVAAEATEWSADLIVVGTHGRKGLERVLLGSGAEQVIRAAATPVLIVRGVG
ncbi:universal stress protein [Caenimonas koreensis]|uniref:universal stress protein n=1 Tax=Caenimonas koreensis TaxID=367474 RepID=UPI0037838835